MSSTLLDKTRRAFVASSDAPTREIIYTRSRDDFEYEPLKCFVGSAEFNKEEKEQIGNYQSFGGLLLAEEPSVGDKVSSDGKFFKVARYGKMGELYFVIGKNSRHSGRPRK